MSLIPRPKFFPCLFTPWQMQFIARNSTTGETKIEWGNVGLLSLYFVGGFGVYKLVKGKRQ